MELALYWDTRFFSFLPNSVHAWYFSGIPLSFDKTSSNSTFPWSFFLTLHCYIYFYTDKNDEIWSKNFGVCCWPNARTLTQCYIRHSEISLSLLFWLNIILYCCNQRLKFFPIITSVHSWVNPVHFKGAQLVCLKHTWWNWHAVPGTAYWNMT